MMRWRTGEPGMLERERAAPPEPGRDGILMQVIACGLCRTDLHVIDHELPVHLNRVVPGHQIVGRVVDIGAEVTDFGLGDLVGVAWLHSTCGICEFCVGGRENLCEGARFTGWDVDGGFSEFAVAEASFAYPLDADDDPVTTAPLLCAGLIGYRALKRANLPPGGVLGIYGFGSSAHLTAQLAMAQGARVMVMTRGKENQALAARLGADFVGGEADVPERPLDSAIVFAPAGDLIRSALRAVDRGGTVVAAGIHMSTIPPIDYDTELFGERDLRSVTANTRADGREFLRLARSAGLMPTVTTYSFDEIPRAVDDLRAGRASGSIVMNLRDRR
jgi:propanol-preferring alcohol dehydrogenase